MSLSQVDSRHFGATVLFPSERKDSQLEASRAQGSRKWKGLRAKCRRRSAYPSRLRSRPLSQINRTQAHGRIHKESRLLLKNEFGTWCEHRDLVFLEDIGPAGMREFRNTWDSSSKSAHRRHEQMRSFFKFSISNGWLLKNPMDGLKKPRSPDVTPTNYFTRDEFQQIVNATYRYAYGGGNDCHDRGQRLRALVLLMRWSGLAIKDAVMLERNRLNEDGSIFLRRAKTGVAVYVPLPPFVVSMLRALPPQDRPWFFWSGNGDPQSAVKAYQRSFWKLFRLAGIKNSDETPKRCHSHMFRDTFAVELLLAGVPIDQVSVLLGHRSVKMKERHYLPWVKARQEQLTSCVQRAWFPEVLS